VQVEHPQGVALGERTVIESGAYLKLVSTGASLTIGAYTFIGRNTEFDVQGPVVLGDHTLIAPGCFITDHSHRFVADRRIDQQPCTTSPVTIGSDVWIGANSVILPGVNVADGAIVGAGAVVTKDVGPMDIVAGVPARKIGSRLDRVISPLEVSAP
jgi:acetyltransferase-like isoleucine patch superfamily enzyme